VTSKNPEAAYLFIEWMMSKENQIRQQKLGGSSARKSTYQDSDVLKLPWTQANIAALGQTHPAMLYTFPESLQIGDVIQRAISDALAGTKSVEGALNWAAVEIHKLLKGKAEMKYPVKQ
jgi:multiple sugar transport system substrate-binding protein